MANITVDNVSIEHLRNANFLAVGTGTSVGSSTTQSLETEVARTPLSILFGDDYIEYRALIQQENLPPSAAVAPNDAVREIGIFWNGGIQLNSGKLLFRTSTFSKQQVNGNDLYIVARIMPNIDTTARIPARPNTPDTPSISSYSPKSVVAEWVEPEDNGSDITKYDIRHRETGTSSWTTVLNQRGLQYAIAGLDELTEYEVQVKAINAIGKSGWSSSGVGETITPEEDEAGTLIFISRTLLNSVQIWKLDNVTDPGSAVHISTISGISFTWGALAYDGDGLILISGGGDVKTISKVTDFLTPSPVRTILSTFNNSSTLSSAVYSEGQLLLGLGNSLYGISDLGNPILDYKDSLSSAVRGITSDGTNYYGITNIGGYYDLGTDIDNLEYTLLASQTLLVPGSGSSAAWNGRLIMLASNVGGGQIFTVNNIANPVSSSHGRLPTGAINPFGAEWITV